MAHVPDFRRARIGKAESFNYLKKEVCPTLPADLSLLSRLRNTAFWYYAAPRAIMSAIAVARRSASLLDFSAKFHKALLLDVATLFSLALLTLGGEILRSETPDLLGTVRAHFYGGPEGIARREQIIEKYTTMVSNLTAQQTLPLDEDGLFTLDAAYLPIIADLLMRLTAHPVEASSVPRYLKVRLMHGVLYDEWDTKAAFWRLLLPTGRQVCD